MALKCICPGLGYAEILRRVNLDTLNVRRDSICQKYVDNIKNICCLTKDITNIILDMKMCTRYELLERIDSVTPLYSVFYTTASKQIY